jgi:hypothetical protein
LTRQSISQASQVSMDARINPRRSGVCGSPGHDAV